MPRAEKKKESAHNTTPIPSLEKDVLKHETPKNIGHDLIAEHAQHHHHRLKIWSSVLAGCFLVVLIILAIVLSRAPVTPPPVLDAPTDDSDEPSVVVEPPPITLSIAWLQDNSSIRNSDTLSATGYLASERDDAAGKRLYYLTDDAGNRVQLVGLQSSDLRLFTSDNKEMYTVRAIVRKVQNSLQLDVKDIEQVP